MLYQTTENSQVATTLKYFEQAMGGGIYVIFIELCRKVEL